MNDGATDVTRKSETCISPNGTEHLRHNPPRQNLPSLTKNGSTCTSPTRERCLGGSQRREHTRTQQRWNSCQFEASSSAQNLRVHRPPDITRSFGISPLRRQ